jgi:hypothetical protein
MGVSCESFSLVTPAAARLAGWRLEEDDDSRSRSRQEDILD